MSYKQSAKRSAKAFFFFLAVAAATLCIAKYGGLIRAQADDVSALDPLNGLRQSRILPKHRLMVSFRDTNFNMENFTATDEAVKGGGWLETNKTDNLRGTQCSSIGSNSSDYVFGSAAAEGYIPQTVQISPDFYGITSFNNVPKNILVNSYLVKNGNLAFDIRKGDEMIGYARVTDVSPCYQFMFYGDVIWHDAPPLDETTITDLVAFDWNNDGYSDYAVTFVTAKGGHNSDTYARLLLVDGKALYEAAISGHELTTASCLYVNGSSGTSIITGSNVFKGDTLIKPVTSIRLTKGDFDGDGVPELAMFTTVIHGAQIDESRPGKLEVFKVSQSGSGFSATTMYSTDHGGSLMENDITGIAAGDIDNDGFDELAALYTETSMSTKSAKAKLSIFKYDVSSKSFNCTAANGKEIATTYKTYGWTNSVSPINAEIADLDGDGYGELVWSSVVDNGDRKTLHVFVQKWEAGKISGTGKQYSYDLQSAVSGINWEIDTDQMHHSLCTGLFNYLDTTSSSYENPPMLIGLSEQGGGNGTANIDYGVFSWNATDGLVCLGHDTFQNQLCNGNLGPNVAAVDIADESMLLGEPQSFSVTNNIETVMVAQAPPKHWDRVLAAGSILSSDAGDGKITVDAFSLFPKDGNAGTMDGYYLAFSDETSSKSGTTTTSTSKGSWGASLSYQLNSRKKLLDKIFANNGRGAGDDPLFSFAASYSGSYAQKSTSDKTSTYEVQYGFEANRDDQLFYKMNCYELSRYPVLYPEKMRLTTVSDDNGDSVSAQNYLQFIVPEYVDKSLSPTNGRNISWYEPMHDNYNLFTYPLSMKEITGYPQGKEVKKESDADDPWLERNGELFGSSRADMGNPDLHYFNINVTDTQSEKFMSSLQQTTSGSTGFHPKFGIDNRHTLKIDLTGDYSWGTDSATTNDVSRMLSLKLYWPGTSTYAPYVRNISTTDMSFRSDFAYYTQDDGTVAVGFAIPTLYGTGSLWGDSGPYCKNPDPGFNLPFRWDPQITSNYVLTANTDPQKRYLLRGIKFEKSLSGTEGSIGNLQNGLGLRILEKGTSYDITLRVINYSFVSAKNVVVKYYYQPLDNEAADASANYPVDDPATSSKCRFIISQDIAVIAGRKGSDDNWVYSNFRWTVPDEVSAGYLHAVIDFGGKTELNADNNHGYTLIGMYDPQIFSPDNRSVSNTQLKTVPVTNRPDLEILSASAREILSDGTLGDEVDLNDSARYKKLRITARVKFTGGTIYKDGKQLSISHVPAVRVGLFAGKKEYNSILGASEFPIMKDGEEREFTFDFDPNNAGYDKCNGVALRLFSPLLSILEQKSSANTTKVLWNASDGTSGSGGCNAGAASLLLLALLPAAAMMKKKKER